MDKKGASSWENKYDMSKETASDTLEKADKIEMKTETAKEAPIAVAPRLTRLKFELCKNWRDKGFCKYGEKCLFAHGEHELSNRMTTKSTIASSEDNK